MLDQKKAFEEFKKAYHNSKCLVKMYLKLGELEKEGKKGSKEYNDIFSLLPTMIDVEKRGYVGLTPLNKFKDCCYAALEEAHKDTSNYFGSIDLDSLVAKRVLNHLFHDKEFALDGVLLDKAKYTSIELSLEERFYWELNLYIQKGKLSKEERETFIDFKYALLSISKRLEEPLFNQELSFPVSNHLFDQEELNKSTVYLLPKVDVLSEYVFSLADEDIPSKDLLVMLLYIKSCISLLEPLCTGTCLQEFKNTIELNYILGAVTHQNKDRINDLFKKIMFTGELLEPKQK